MPKRNSASEIGFVASILVTPKIYIKYKRFG
jgi:hypothetical protein